MDKRKEDAIKKLRESCCIYPMQNEESGEMKSCGKKQMMSISLPILNATESGKVVSSIGEEGGVSIPIPLCNYHAMLAMATGMFGLKTDDKMNVQQLIAPLDIIHIAESVVNAMAMTGKIQEIFKTKEDTEKEIKSLER